MIPMNSPGWFDDLPESMTEAEYRALSEEISRTIEIVHGHVIKCESPVPRHNRIARRMPRPRGHGRWSRSNGPFNPIEFDRRGSNGPNGPGGRTCYPKKTSASA